MGDFSEANSTTRQWPKKEGKACQEQNIQESAQKSASSKANSPKYVYDFGNKTDGDATQRSLLGGKGANLAEMAKIGLPVPPGFTITTEVCTYFYANKQSYPKVLEEQVRASVARTEKQLGKNWATSRNLYCSRFARAGIPCPE